MTSQHSIDNLLFINLKFKGFAKVIAVRLFIDNNKINIKQFMLYYRQNNKKLTYVVDWRTTRYWDSV